MSVPIEIDAVRALDLLEREVEGNEEYIYNPVDFTCHYAHEGQPSCLIGRALYQAGVPVDVLEDMNGWGVIVAHSIRRILAIHNVYVTEGALKVFYAAQVRQDVRGRWGEALLDAKKAFVQVIVEEVDDDSTEDS
ncbi:hypothetical protein [Phytoactinopolyspora halophila]|uniref:hypothetical protein n=1 Tax=Phytoactinopolyspora halophila TaxID=1981511 RepID=UPI000F4E0999|nr:hypothetical protein [Phytoactinopolyspora halophila]